MRVSPPQFVGLVLAAIVASPPAGAQVSFQRIVGTGDPLPGAPPGTTINYPFEAQAAGEWIAFGTISAIGSGVYAWDGQTVQRVVDELTPVPGGSPTISPFPGQGQMDVDASGSVVVLGFNHHEGVGVWRWNGGDPVELVIRAGNPSPTMPGETVLAAMSPRVSGATTYAMVEHSGDEYILDVLAFPMTGLPYRATPPGFIIGSETFDASRTALLFRATSPTPLNGLWQQPFGEGADLLLSPGDPVEGANGDEPWTGGWARMLRFGLGGAVLFGGGELGTRGFFVVRDSREGEALIRHGDPEPRTGQPVLTLPDLYASASDQRFAFVAWIADGSRHLSVREPDGSFLPILSTGDVLDGEVVTDIEISTKAFVDDNRLVAVIHRQTEAAIWTIDLPPIAGPPAAAIPTTSTIGLAVLALLLAVGGSLVASRSRRRASRSR